MLPRGGPFVPRFFRFLRFSDLGFVQMAQVMGSKS
jgi:hypothetical protein